MVDLNKFFPSAKNLHKYGFTEENAIKYSGHVEEVLYTKAFGKFFEVSDGKILNETKMENLSRARKSIEEYGIFFEYDITNNSYSTINNEALLRSFYAYTYLNEDEPHYMLKEVTGLIIATEYPEFTINELRMLETNYRHGSATHIVKNLTSFFNQNFNYEKTGLRKTEYLSSDWEDFNRQVLIEIAESYSAANFQKMCLLPIPLTQWDYYREAPIEWLDEIAKKSSNAYV